LREKVPARDRPAKPGATEDAEANVLAARIATMTADQ
jgi:hypothetical protein